ncbi:DUF4190 domain-containing protein [Frigoribacterium sp. PvP032]|uniref:DUF4190 domain-containing protein n=1 Tax=Frigoribacterium sp. PvP032 TaxID=2806589 RepID=UPI001AEA4944|nr:DUF4190 domain-containing protein [Frigoribacterium sp. PvP032]MBP1189360.1 hypothetical protein [Frigoribacterium sp. PvP032]
MTDDRTPSDDADADQQDADQRDADRQATEDLGHPVPDLAPQPAPGPQAAQPAPAAPATQASQPRSGASGWAVAALVVGIGAFLLGLVPVVGLLVALAGVALGVVALVRRRRAQTGLGLGVTGVVLSGLAAVTNVAVVAVLVVAVPVGARLADEAASSWYGWDTGQGLDGDPYGSGQGSGYDDADGDGAADPVAVTTSCWSFSLPDDAWVSGDDSDADACATSFGVADDTAVTPVQVVTVPAAVAADLVPATSADRVADAVAALRPSWLPGVGTVLGEPEPTTLDGQPAALVRLAAGNDLGTPAAVVVAWSPADATGASSLTLVTVGSDTDTDTDLGYGSADGASAAARTAAARAAAERALTSVTTTWDWTVR